MPSHRKTSFAVGMPSSLPHKDRVPQRSTPQALWEVGHMDHQPCRMVNIKAMAFGAAKRA
uniref:Uncharacterized protein n=1 Tax=Oryza nivara TaxID=4536 RepID=A0A0E0GNZ8_ORYNI